VSVCLSVCLSIRVGVSLCVWLSVCLSAYARMHACLPAALACFALCQPQPNNTKITGCAHRSSAPSRRSKGVAVLGSSRGPGFVEELCLGGGVDVVLNSLTSPGMVCASLAALKQGGR
jgi:hypothetical protein